MSIGENILNLRKKKNLTQEELANAIEVSPQMISSYEKNKKLPSIEKLIALSEALNTSVDKIIGLNDKNKKEVHKEYKKIEFKHNLFNYILVAIVFIIPLIFFLWAGYISINSIGANIYANLELTNEEFKQIFTMINNAWFVLKIMAYEYIIYSILLFLNYIFYKKGYKILLIILNVIVLIIFIIDFISTFIQNETFYNYDLLIFVISSLIGLYYAYKLYESK